MGMAVAMSLVIACGSDDADDGASTTADTGAADDGTSAADASTGAAASTGADGSTGAVACDADTPKPILHIDNQTGNGFDVIYFVHCDGTEPSEFPLVPQLATGASLEIPMPGPGCWILDYDGDGCSAEPPHQTEMDVCAGDTYVWTAGPDTHVCAG